MELFLQTVINGLGLGASYGLVAVGLAVVYGIGKVVNFAHGEFLMVASYAALASVAAGFPYWLAALVGIVCAGVLGVLVERLLLAQGLYSAPEHASIIVMFALSLGLQNLAQIIFGSDAKRIESPLTSVRVGSSAIGLDGQRFVTAILAMLILAGLAWWLRASRLGTQLRAISQNPRGALYSGINASGLRTVTFVLGAVLAGVAGVLLAPSSSVYPGVGLTAVVAAFTVVTLGGLGSVTGAIVSGFLVGLVYAFVATYVSTSWTEAVGWLVVISILLARPQGLFGAKPTRA